ncbi:MAG: nucleotidyl transferase AbiEii/AbiGii toxin family protein [Chlamydiia bacterium]|nr:nucleotidyl transferase AbiEii/AbiGii toxin family protein [Chlamydiia bacterium]
MKKGLSYFKEHFADYSDQYVLIGGTACSLVMEDVGLDFRATKDLDIVLYIEALDAGFASSFWKFIRLGKYQHRQRSTDKEIFYRFSGPKIREFPAMLELFSRVPDCLKIVEGSHLTPIPIHESITSLSAILLDNTYYQFIHDGKQSISGLPVVSASHLIPLKARAWIDLIGRKDANERDIRKHKNDIMRLCQLLTPSDKITLPQPIKQDMQQFLNRVQKESFIDLKSLGIKNINLDDLFATLRQIYDV